MKDEQPFRGFVWTAKAWYAKALDQDSKNGITFGLYYDEGGTAGEMSIRWHALEKDQLTPRLEVFEDAWAVFAGFGNLISELAAVSGENISQEEFVEILLRCGFRDLTKYNDPYATTPPPEKSLGQIAYEASPEGGQQNWGPWEKAPEVVRRVHEEMAQVVANHIQRKHRVKQ